ncbi:MAG: OmpP1/FadL family transporter [Bacteriovoracaceae bacterium]
MKKIILFSLLYSMSVMATNAVNLTSSSTKGMGVAGNGISQFYSVQDALIKNPATLTQGQNQIDVSLLSLLPNVKTRDKSQDSSYRQSAITYVPIPSFGISYKYSSWNLGAGLVPVAGLASDFKKETSVFELAPSLTIINLPVSVAKKMDKLSVGASLIGAIGSASINTSKTAFTPSQSERNPNYQLGYGYNLGAIYEATEALTLGLSYKSKTYFKFERQTDLESYVGVQGTSLDDLELETPEEIGFGITQKIKNNLFSLEAKRLYWGSARGFKSYDWQNQDVISGSWLYEFEKSYFSLGYAYSDQVFSSKKNENGSATKVIEGVSLTQQNVSYFNVVGYPAILRHKITAGYGYELNEKLTLQSSVLYCPEETIRRSGVGFNGAYDYQTKISFLFINVGASYKF